MTKTLDPIVQAFKAEDGTLHETRAKWLRHEVANVLQRHGTTRSNIGNSFSVWTVADNWGACVADLQALGLVPETQTAPTPVDDGVAGDGI